LQRVLGLDSLNDDAEEIDAMGFGTLIHAVAEEFGRNENIIDSTNQTTIYEFLEDKLETLVRTNFGEQPRATIAIQVEMAKKRLDVFANEQAKWRQLGYRVERVEYKIDNVYLDVDGKKIRLKGRIDRIDQHETTGERVVFDYKTGSTEPEEKHRKGKKENREWIDFQLPLYHYILQQNGLGDSFKLGYFLISSDPKKIKPSFANWNIAEIEEAIEEAREIVRKIWNKQFPINPKAKYQEEYETICPDVLIK
jgi:ATP-dependent helicase/DNAse subunit B